MVGQYDVRDERVVLSTGMTFHIRMHGAEDAPPLIFLHGVFAAAISFDVLCRLLARCGRRVIAIDQRGHGGSDHAADYAWERWVGDIESILDALELGPVDLAGHSMGAGHAGRFAALHPGRVRRLALLEGGFGRPNHPNEAEYWSRIARLFPPDGFASLADYVDLVMRVFPRATRSIVEESTDGFVCGNDRRWHWPLQADVTGLAESRTDPSPGREAALRRLVTSPTLVARAEFSEVFVGDSYVRVAEEYQRGTHLTLSGTGHMIMWEGVDQTVAAIDDFLS
jgi:pimeloyl-ACP methyl ester carboxylesterase